MANTDPQTAREINPEVPHSARVWNYWLGGKDNYPADRAVGDQVKQVFPDIVEIARLQRAFLGRAVTYLVEEAGIRQFLDVGTGLPTADNTHEVAQRAAPEARVVYVDNDPLVLAHARALLTSTPEGVTEYVDADFREPERVLAQARLTLDFDQPVALILMGIVGHLPDHRTARGIITALLAELPSGSYLVLADGTDTDPSSVEAHRQYNENAPLPYNLRPPQEIRSFFDGLEPVEPGIVACTLWRPAPVDVGVDREIAELCAVARKP
ncbi:SAM-dependent methyltransferase [Nocardiopsis exhalans]|uniref:SAM-dependent methyltransferase n=1 Tax=Nocardiopsis exhalans TaxID=163604 RepID=A0ABY5D4K1_9ACTN|nr:SAM-dependent methyltransferase [Nocardiopsis exhalans]USY17780.1 SAM-dependent methyltransferase [Nocardiopsis exhalans]